MRPPHVPAPAHEQGSCGVVGGSTGFCEEDAG